MRERLRDERGVALVVALLVTFVVLLLSTTVFAMAVRNSEQSANDRKRLQSVSAAEAGLNAAYQHITAPPSGLAGLTDTLTDTVGSGPGGSTYDVEITYYENEDGTVPMTSPSVAPYSITYYPKSALISSVGASNGKIDRTMETFVVLSPVFSGFEGAIVSHSSLNLTNRFTLNGYLGDDGHIYVLNGDFNAPSGLETIKGNVYVPAGSAMIGTSVHVYGTVWANGDIILDQPQVIIDGDVKSTAGGIDVLAGTVAGQGYYCTTVGGDSAIAGGAQQTCTLGTPPNQPFPQIKYDQTAWATNDPPYTNFQTFTSCTAARDYVQNTGTYAGTGFSGRNVGRTVVFINATCSFEPTNNATIVLKNDLAIISRGAVNFAQRSSWDGESGIKYLHVMSVYPDAGAPICPTQDVTIGQFTNFDGHVAGIVYSPCTVRMLNNNTAFQGQVIGENVVIGNNFNMNFLPVKVPGQKLTGFKQDIAYIREVR